VRDEWEPQGMARDSSVGVHYEYRGDEYERGTFSLSGAEALSGVRILIRDRDTDDDNVMDGWEWEHLDPTFVLTGTGDQDGDGLSDIREYGADSDPHNQDTDGDGLLDGAEVDTYGTSSTTGDSDGDTLPDDVELGMAGMSPTNSDDDDDGVPTAIEVAWDGTAGSVGAGDMDPLLSDTDGDSIPDLMEIAAGSDPLSAASAAVIALSGVTAGPMGTVQLSWPVGGNLWSVDVTYVVEFSSDLVTWIAVGEVTGNGDASPTSLSLAADMDDSASGFYRLRLMIE
jgi:hypothetical protein